MDNKDVIEEQHPQLVVTEEMRSHFYEMAKWAKFLGTFGLIIAGLVLLSAFSTGALLQQNSELAKMAQAAGGAGMAAMAAMLVIYGLLLAYPSWLLLQYARQAQIGVLYGEQQNLNLAFSKLKLLFKFWGIMVMVFMFFYLITMAMALLGGK